MTLLKMCRDTECPNFDRCYRAQAEPAPVDQPYFDRSPHTGETCIYFAPVEYSDGTSARIA